MSLFDQGNRPALSGKICLSIVLMLGLAASLPAQIEEVPNDGVMAEAAPREWAPPVYPPAAIKDKVEGQVVVDFVIDPEGKVAQLAWREPKNEAKRPDARLVEAVIEAAKKWTFSPALNESKPEAVAVSATVSFYLKGRGGKPSVTMPLVLESMPTKPARVVRQPDPPYPEETLHRKLPGTTEFQFDVSKEGKVENIVVMYASDAAFVAPGLATLNRWMFEPASQGPLKVISRKHAPMQFDVVGENTSNEAILEANGISGLSANTVEVPPVPRSLPAPVYPRDRLIADESGTAEVEFTIDEKGLTKNVAVMSASQPEFGDALAAAVAAWVFKPALYERSRTTVNLRAKYDFALGESHPTARLVAAIKAGTVTGAGGLDQRLTPLWRVPPVYPHHLLEQKTTGTATIEFIIDREGRARFPRVKETTLDAFGWAAMTAISQWVFAPPTRQGEPVDVRVNIPLEFTPPES